MLPTITVSPVRQGLCGVGHGRMGCFERSLRSIAGGFYDAILETPGQTLGHARADTLPGAAQRGSRANQAGCGLIMSNARARATSHVMDNEIEAKAKALCADAGCDPGETVMHAYGDDFTVLEWQYRWTSNTAISGQPMISPMWRLYRARAVIELSRLPKAVEIGGNVIPFRRRNS